MTILSCNFKFGKMAILTATCQPTSLHENNPVSHMSYLFSAIKYLMSLKTNKLATEPQLFGRILCKRKVSASYSHGHSLRQWPHKTSPFKSRTSFQSAIVIKRTISEIQFPLKSPNTSRSHTYLILDLAHWAHYVLWFQEKLWQLLVGLRALLQEKSLIPGSGMCCF